MLGSRACHTSWSQGQCPVSSMYKAIKNQMGTELSAPQNLSLECSVHRLPPAVQGEFHGQWVVITDNWHHTEVS
jgi:hypothetical protein